MLSKSQIRFIFKLQKKKFRDAHKLFVAEGSKLVMDLLNEGLQAKFLIFSEDWKKQHQTRNLNHVETEIETDLNQIKKISTLKTPTQVLAVFRQPDICLNKKNISNSLSVVLDDIQDPGNLGSIIRTADWFGIEHVFCSVNTADFYNPKVIQASMGSIARVKIVYTPLNLLLKEYQSPNFPFYGTFPKGENLFEAKLSKKGFIIMGNEGKGISSSLRCMLTHRVSIPCFPANKKTSESLNVSVATAIICAEFRKLIKQ